MNGSNPGNVRFVGAAAAKDVSSCPIPLKKGPAYSGAPPSLAAL
jgi:hypothetical protein